MGLTPETIQKVLDISAAETIDATDVHGVNTLYSTKPLHQIIAAPTAMIPSVKVSTLAGFADLVRAALDAQDFPANYIIHVEDETTVTLKARVSDEYGRRQVLVQAKPVEFAKFTFSQWVDQERFAIAIASLFADTPDKAYVLNLAASLTNEATTNSEDNGFTQRATVKAGLQLKANVTLKPRVSLAPFRTFPEVEQPLSEFVFRARCRPEEVPSLMLIEADGGRWKVNAIAALRDAIDAFGLCIPIVA